MKCEKFQASRKLAESVQKNIPAKVAHTTQDIEDWLNEED